MKRIYTRAMLAMAVSSVFMVSAQAQTNDAQKYAEKVTAVTPLTITSGLNADVIAERKATDSKDYTTQSSGWYSTTYTSKLATMIDDDNDHGRSAFFTTGVQEKGAIKYTADGYLDGNNDSYGSHPLKYKLAAADGNNALLLTKNNTTGTLKLKPAEDGKIMPAASMIYLLATSAEGSTTVNVTIYGTDGTTVLGETTVTIGDWWSNHQTEKLTQVYETLRISVKGSNTKGTKWGEMNYVNSGEAANGTFWLQRIGVSTKSSEPVGSIKITRTSSSKGNAAIFAATAVEEEVTLEDTETSLDYLYNESTHQRIAEGTKAKVTLKRTFYADNENSARWQPFVFFCPLTVKQAKDMFGKDIKVSVANEKSYVNNRVIFYPITMDDEDATLIEPGKYYLISGIETNDENSYTHEYLEYKNPSDYTGSAKEYTVNNTDNSGRSITFHGVYVAGKEIGEGSYALSGGKFYKYTDNPTIKGFRFWFTASEDETANELDMVVSNTVITGIDEINNTASHANEGNVYTMDGRLVRSHAQSLDGLAKGLYIVNGKKVIVK